jgi:Zn-dependent oligopeptidase
LRVKGESAFERLSPEQQIAARAFKLEFELSGIHLSDDKRKKVRTRDTTLL